MIQRGLDDGMYDRSKRPKGTEKGNIMGDIISTEKRQREKGEVLKGPPRVSTITQAPQPSLFLSGMTLSSVLSLHWVNRIITLNNYTDIPGTSVLSRKSNSSDENPMV